MSTAANAATCEVSKAQYDQLKNGMTLAEAVRVLGCEGEEMSSSEIAGISTVMFMWWGASFGGNMNAMFQNGKMVTKAQFGLK
ncbi:DUF3862 domain-containing protein [Mongoliimonas terrestris]|uniref:DUF3862 domain-containing protein n=1 Tax=Mongoliimonas terrestris TaxID=1709001 RepID=UPI001AED1210|nr:DUF3862 domain-containing protein [Mongoliimonas terrestris]